MVKKHLHRFAKYCSQRMLAIGLTLLVIAAVGGLVYATTVVINGCQAEGGGYFYKICQRIFPVSDPLNTGSTGTTTALTNNYQEITLPPTTAPGWSGHRDAGRTYRITTTSGNSYFIPFKSTAEWDAFKAHKPADLSLCGVKLSIIVAPQSLLLITTGISAMNLSTYLVFLYSKI